MARLDEYLSEVMQRRGSDLHLLAGDPPRIRLHGDLMPLRQDRLPADFVREALYEIMPRKAIERFEARDGAEVLRSVDHPDRFVRADAGGVRLDPAATLFRREFTRPGLLIGATGGGYLRTDGRSLTLAATGSAFRLG